MINTKTNTIERIGGRVIAIYAGSSLQDCDLETLLQQGWQEATRRAPKKAVMIICSDAVVIAGPESWNLMKTLKLSEGSPTRVQIPVADYQEAAKEINRLKER